MFSFYSEFFLHMLDNNVNILKRKDSYIEITEKCFTPIRFFDVRFLVYFTKSLPCISSIWNSLSLPRRVWYKWLYSTLWTVIQSSCVKEMQGCLHSLFLIVCFKPLQRISILCMISVSALRKWARSLCFSWYISCKKLRKRRFYYEVWLWR